MSNPLEDIDKENGSKSWYGHRERQLKELGIDPEELDDE